MSYLYTRSIPEGKSYDILVAGGGVAGCAAALEAARGGKSVALLEKSVMLGGLATIGLINFFVPMCNGRGKQICKGMAEEFLRLSVAHGYDTLPPEWKEGEPKVPTDVRYITHYSAAIFALELTKLLTDAGVELYFDTQVVDPVMEGNIAQGLVVENKSGLTLLKAGMIIDTTGDADVLYRAGVPTFQGRNFHTYIAQGFNLSSMEKALDKKNISFGYTSFTGGPASLYGDNHPAGMPYYKGTSGEDVNTYFVRNQLECLEKISADDRTSRDIARLPAMAQFRTTRHIVGSYSLKVKDAFAHFEDSVTAINDFDRRDFLFEVPYRTLVHPAYPNLITAGRTAAGDDYAWDLLRVIPPAILTGQAAGAAASLALEQGVAIADVNISRLQQKLADENVMIHFDDAWVCPSPDFGRVDENGHF